MQTLWSSHGDFKIKDNGVVILNHRAFSIYTRKEHIYPFCYGIELKGQLDIYNNPIQTTNLQCFSCEYKNSCELLRWRNTKQAKQNLKKLRILKRIRKAHINPYSIGYKK